MLTWLMLNVAFFILTIAAAEQGWPNNDARTCDGVTGVASDSTLSTTCPAIKEQTKIHRVLVNDSYSADGEHPWASILEQLPADEITSQNALEEIAKNEILGLPKTIEGGWARKIPKQAYDYNPFSALYKKPPAAFVNNNGQSLVGCSNPGPLKHGNSSDTKTPVFRPGSVLDFSCEPNSHLIGAQRLTCLLSGTWSDDKPACLTDAFCGEVQTPVGGTVQYLPPLKNDDQIRAALSVFDYSHGSFIPHHVLDLVTVAPPPGNASQNPGTKGQRPRYMPGTRVLLSCKPKFYKLEGSQTRICRKDGRWSGRDTLCKPECGVHMESRTSPENKTVAPLMRWPWQAGIGVYIDRMRQWILQCGGTLINEEWILTAAHCLSKDGPIPLPLNVVFIYLGKYYRDDSQDDQYVQYRSPRKLIIHPEYNPKQFDYDIALIWLLKPVEFTARVQPACLPSSLSSDMNIVRGAHGVVPGWGKTQNGNFLSVMHELRLPIIGPQECAKKYREAGHNMMVTDRMFCAGTEDGHADACGGDSGGPMLFQDILSGKWTVEGVVSWGSPDGCALKGQYGGYTRVNRFMPWLHLYI